MPIKAPCSEPTRARLGSLVVLEGMPGAGKTTATDALASHGHQVIGEYLTSQGATIPVRSNPGADHDAAHQANWLLKHHFTQHARRRGTVYCDRDWISALAYAASLDDDQLLDHRTQWAIQQLQAGRLTVADHYLVLHIDPATSLTRRTDRLPRGHPWNQPTTLHRLAQFYTDPTSAAGAVDPRLGQALAQAHWHHLHHPSRQAIQRHLRALTDQP